jgi:hypothetical protein
MHCFYGCYIYHDFKFCPSLLNTSNYRKLSVGNYVTSNYRQLSVGSVSDLHKKIKVLLDVPQLFMSTDTLKHSENKYFCIIHILMSLFFVFCKTPLTDI